VSTFSGEDQYGFQTMTNFLRSFRRVAAIVLGIYWAAVVLFIIGSTGEFWGIYCMIMLWLQVGPSKLIIEALPFSIEALSIYESQFWLIIFVVGTLVNSVLLTIGAFSVTGIYSLAVASDQKIASKLSQAGDD
jgi:hypothetical protein